MTAQKPGIHQLFNPLPDDLTIEDKCLIWCERHASNYFLDCDQEYLDSLRPHHGPKMVVTKELHRLNISSTTKQRNKKLQFVLMFSEEPWCLSFIERMQQPGSTAFKSVYQAQMEAAKLWKEHSGQYRSLNATCQAAAGGRAYIGRDKSKSRYRHHQQQEEQKCRDAVTAVEEDMRKRLWGLEQPILQVTEMKTKRELVQYLREEEELLKERLGEDFTMPEKVAEMSSLAVRIAMDKHLFLSDD